MDDPTTYLVRDANDVCIMLASSVEEAMFQAKQYGCSIQVNMAGGIGIRCVVSIADALAMSGLPVNTPWCMAHDVMTDREAWLVLRARFGPPVTVDKALRVETKGIAWRPGQFRRGMV